MREGDGKSMRILLVTVAGLSSRFSQSVGYPCLKCLYCNGKKTEALLYRLIHMYDFDRYIIVGGYRYEELAEAVKHDYGDIRDRVSLVRNELYAEAGSGYSLYLGLVEAFKWEFSEIVFAEGDLIVDRGSFARVCEASGDVLTVNRDAIQADKAVAFYFDREERIHYIYDTGHKCLEIREPFLSIYNSGQIWKFADSGLLRKTMDTLGEERQRGTNLSLIEEYFGHSGNPEIITFDKWVNCNTVQDYNTGIAEIYGYENIE